MNNIKSSKIPIPRTEAPPMLTPPEPFVTIPSAAEALGLKYHALLRAVNAGLIPSYQPFGARTYVLLSEVVAYVKAHQNRGPNDG